MNLAFLNNEEIDFLDNEYTTVQNISDYFNVPTETIKTIIKRNRMLLVKHGYKTIKGDSLKDFIKCKNGNLNSKTRSLSLINRECIVVISYLLTKTDITLKIINLNKIYNRDFHNELIQSHTHNDYIKKYEKELGFLIHSIFDEFHIIEDQVKCGRYYIDFVIDNELAIECDENGHSYYDNESEIKREKYIISKGYRILRYDTRENNMLGFIGKISNDLCTNFHT